MANDDVIKGQFDEAYNTAFAYWQPFLDAARKDMKFALGDQWNAVDKEYLKNQRRTMLTFNKVHRVIKLIEGYQRRNRLAFKVDPVEGSDEATANQLSAVLMWLMTNSDGYNKMSDAFAFSLMSSINLINIYIDYSQDPVSGDIRLKRIPYNKFLLDPNFSERDLSDCEYLLRRECLSKSAVKMLLPDHAKDIEQMQPKGQDGKYTQFRQATDLRGDKLMNYDEFLVRDYKQVKLLFDRETKEQRTFDGDSEELKEIKQKYPDIEIVDSSIKTVELRILVDGHVMYTGPEQTGLDDFSYVPIMAFWTPEYEKPQWKLRNVVSLIRDAQEEINKRKSKMLDIVDSVISTGLKVEEGSLVDDKDAYQTGQGKVLWIKKGQMSAVQEIQGRDIPQGIFQLNKVLEQDVMEIVGANTELFGTPSNDADVPGVLAKMRQASGLTILQDLFDNYRLSKRIVGRKIIKIIQKNYTPDKIRRIIGEEPSKEILSENFGKYDVIPVEGILSDTQRQMSFAQLIEFKKMGMAIPDQLIIDQAPIENKKAIKEAMAAQAKSAQAAQKEEAADKKLMSQLMQAKTAEDVAQAQERRTQSRENEESAMLNKIKQLKELEKLDISKIKEYLGIIETVAKISQMGPEKTSLVRR